MSFVYDESSLSPKTSKCGELGNAFFLFSRMEKDIFATKRMQRNVIMDSNVMGKADANDSAIKRYYSRRSGFVDSKDERSTSPVVGGVCVGRLNRALLRRASTTSIAADTGTAEIPTKNISITASLEKYGLLQSPSISTGSAIASDTAANTATTAALAMAVSASASDISESFIPYSRGAKKPKRKIVVSTNKVTPTGSVAAEDRKNFTAAAEDAAPQQEGGRWRGNGLKIAGLAAVCASLVSVSVAGVFFPPVFPAAGALLLVVVPSLSHAKDDKKKMLEDEQQI